MSSAPDPPASSAADRSAPDAELFYAPEEPVDVGETLFPLRRGHLDPLGRWLADGSTWRTQRTPEGASTVHLCPIDGGVLARAWGDGAGWTIAHVPQLLGEGDDWRAFDELLTAMAADGTETPLPPGHPRLAEVRRRRHGMRLLRTNLVLEASVAAVIEQKVTGVEARRGWRGLIRLHGEVAPGPIPASVRDGMMVFPTAEAWRRIPDHDWHRAGVGPQRMRTVRRVAAVAASLERTLTLGRGGEAVEAALTSIPGVGVWTAAEITQRAHGDPDAISVGDYHLAGLVGHYLTGRRTDDAEMVELLRPFAGHRQRVVRLITASGVTAPRFGPKLTIQDHRAH